MNREWSDLNKDMQALIKKKDTFPEGKETLFKLRDELMETVDFGLCSDELFTTGTVAAFQRLGYLLEEILDCRSQAQVLHQRLKDHGLPFRWVDLSRQTQKHVHIMSENAKWKILVNAKIEVDDL